MEQRALELKEIFNGLVDGFGLNHAQVYYTLLSSEIKTAKQVIDETGVNQATTYAVLRELLKWELIQHSNTNPTSYYIDNPIKDFEQPAPVPRKIDETKDDIDNDYVNSRDNYYNLIDKGNQAIEGRNTIWFDNEIEKSEEKEYELKENHNNLKEDDIQINMKDEKYNKVYGNIENNKNSEQLSAIVKYCKPFNFIQISYL